MLTTYGLKQVAVVIPYIFVSPAYFSGPHAAWWTDADRTGVRSACGKP